MKTIKQILHFFMLTLLILIGIFSLSSCSHSSIEKEVNKILKNDLKFSIEIIKLYHNEEKQGCFVEFRADSYSDKAAINLNTDTIDYESEYDYYVEKAERLRKQTPINETALHECNQKILNSLYPEWSFSVTVFEANGRPEDSDWKRLK